MNYVFVTYAEADSYAKIFMRSSLLRSNYCIFSTLKFVLYLCMLQNYIRICEYNTSWDTTELSNVITEVLYLKIFKQNIPLLSIPMVVKVTISHSLGILLKHEVQSGCSRSICRHLIETSSFGLYYDHSWLKNLINE